MARSIRHWTRVLALMLVAPVIAAAQSFETIAPDLHLLRGAFVPGQQPDGNSVMLLGPRGWIVVDTGRHVIETEVGPTPLLYFAVQN